MFNKLEKFILCNVIKLALAAIAAYIVYFTMEDEVAKICYKGGTNCLIEVDRASSPNAFWVILGLYIFGMVVFLVSAFNDVGRHFRSKDKNNHG